jgi:hypothetical protein
MSDADRDGALPIPRSEYDPPTHLFASTGAEHPRITNQEENR